MTERTVGQRTTGVLSVITGLVMAFGILATMILWMRVVNQSDGEESLSDVLETLDYIMLGLGIASVILGAMLCVAKSRVVVASLLALVHLGVIAVLFVEAIQNLDEMLENGFFINPELIGMMVDPFTVVLSGIIITFATLHIFTAKSVYRR